MQRGKALQLGTVETQPLQFQTLSYWTFTVKRRHNAVQAVPLFLSLCSWRELSLGLHVGGQRSDQLTQPIHPAPWV